MNGSAGLALVAAALFPLPGAVAMQAAPPAAGPVAVDDFEAPALGPGWTSSDAEIRLVPEGTGHALEIVGKGLVKDSRPRAGVTLPIKDLRGMGAVALRIASMGGPLWLSVFLRKGTTFRTLEEFVVLNDKEWHEMVLPLRLMVGGSSGLLPDPRELDRLEFQWEGVGGGVRIDDIRLLPGDRGEDSWRTSEEDLLELAFGRGKGRIQQGKHFSLLSASSSWQGPEATRFLADLELGVALVEARWGIQPPPGIRVPLLCCWDINESNGLRGRVLAAFRSMGLFPSNALDVGFEPFDLAYPPPGKGSFGKPSATGMTTYLGYALGVNDRCWLARSLYWAYMRRTAPDALKSWARATGKVTGQDFQNLLLGKPTLVPAWSTLLDGRQSYLHEGALLTVPEFLASAYRAKLPKAWEAVRAIEGDPDTQAMAAIAGALDTTPAKLEDQWARWGAANWK